MGYHRWGCNESDTTKGLSRIQYTSTPAFFTALEGNPEPQEAPGFKMVRHCSNVTTETRNQNSLLQRLQFLAHGLRRSP